MNTSARVLLLLALGILGACEARDKLDTSVTEQGPKMQVRRPPIGEVLSGYHSDAGAWSQFLACWASRQEDYSREKGVTHKFRWKSAAQDANKRVMEIRRAEERVGVTFPPSLLHFLEAGGGGFRFGSPAPTGNLESRFLNIGEVNWFPKAYPDIYAIWAPRSKDQLWPKDEEYYRYGWNSGQLPMIREAQLAKMLVVGSLEGEGLLLLNPNERTNDGEWEAMALIWKGGVGAKRYLSFAELARNQFFELAFDVKHAQPYPEEQLRGTCADLLRPKTS